MENTTISLFGARITWRRMMRVFCTFFLIILCSQLTTMLNLKTADLQQDILLENIQKLRFDYFKGVEDNLNEFFVEYNYSAFEYSCNYFGTGEILTPDWVINPELTGGLHQEDHFGVDPRKELEHEWVRIGRTVIFNGVPQFQPSNIATNGTHIALVYTFERGKWKGQEYVSSLVRYNIDYFLDDLITNAHNAIEGLNEVSAAIADRNYRANKFKELFKKARKNNRPSNINLAETSINNMIKYFNGYLGRNGLLKYLRAVKVPNRDTGAFDIKFGRYTYANCRVYGSVNQTIGKAYVFRESLEYLPLLDRFRFKEGLTNRLSLEDRSFKDYLELFEYLNRTATELRISDFCRTTNHYPITTDIYMNYYEQGAVNTYNYDYWHEDLLAVAVVSDWSSGETNLPKLLEEAIKNDVYGFLDKFSFKDYGTPATNWKEILLTEEDMRIENYDILFIDDYSIDNWNEAWSLSEKEAQVLAEWLYRGGSLFLSSAISGTQSIVKDKLFPAEYIQMKVGNVILDGEFLVDRDPIYLADETPVSTALTYWDTYTDTRIANLYMKGEFANVDTYAGLPPGALRMGVIDEFEDGVGWTYDCPSPDKEITITQQLSVPTSYAKCYFTLQYMKRTSLETDKLELYITDSNNKEVLHKVIVDSQSTVDTTWQSIGKIDLTSDLRPYSGETLYLHLKVTGDPQTRIIMTHTSHPYIVPPGVEYWVYADFHIDNLMCSFLGDKSTTNILVYQDEELMDSIDSQEYGNWLYPNGNNYENYPYLGIDQYRSRYLADELLNQLQVNGMLNSKKVDTQELLDFFKFNQSGIIIPAHPFSEEIYNGTANSKIIKWVYDTGGVMFDLQAEPLAYYINFDNELTRVEEADLAILGYDLFRINSLENEEYTFTYYNENFDDVQSGFTVTGSAEIYLDDYIGGFLNISVPGSYSDYFPTDMIIRDGVNFMNNNVSAHFDVYLTDTVHLLIHGKDSSGNYLGVECTLGVDDIDVENNWYVNTENNTVYISIPFDDQSSPSELVRNKWNAILFNLDITKTALNKEFYSITGLEIITTQSNVAVDNCWIGYAGSTYQSVNDWFVQTLTPFASDYPLSLKVLYDMKNDNGDFDFSVFGKNEQVKKLQFFNDFTKLTYPENDDWTERSITGWEIGNEQIFYDTANSQNGNGSLAWVRDSESGNITLHFNEFDMREYLSLNLAVLSNISMPLSFWENPSGVALPKLTIRDANENELYYYLSDYIETEWKSIVLDVAAGTKVGDFDYSRITTIELFLPEWTNGSYILSLDDLHFLSGLSDKAWNWNGFVSFIDDFLILKDPWGLDESWISTKEKFGLGTIQFNAQFSPNSEVKFGLFGENTEDGSAYFHYKGFDEYWWHPDWKNRKKLTISGAYSNLYNFPVNLTIPKEQEMQEDAEDLRFIWKTSNLPYEITSIDDDSIHLWLLIPVLSTSKTELYMYYNNQLATYNKEKYEAVWDTNYMSVVHFDYFNGGAPPSVIQIDSTTYDHFIMEEGYDRYTEGIHEEGIEFDRTDGEYGVMVDNDYYLDFTDGMTLEAWIKPEFNSYSSNWHSDIISKDDSSGDNSYRLYYQYNHDPWNDDWVSVKAEVFNNDVSYLVSSFESNLTFDSWYYVACTYDGSQLSLYINGDLIDSEIVGGSIDVSSDDIYIGESRHLFGKSFEGNIDEIRLSEIARSQDWLKQTYLTLNGNLTIEIVEDWNLVEMSYGPESWWDFNWRYRQKITIENPNAGDITDYQIPITLGSLEIPFDYYKAQHEGDDLRFTCFTTKHTEIDYWIETWNIGGESTIWIEVPNLKADTITDIYLYFGNAIAESCSLGDNTFLFFDDFEDDSLDSQPNGWIIENSIYGNLLVSSGAIQGSKCAHYTDSSTSSAPEVHRYLNNDISNGDMIFEYWISPQESSSSGLPYYNDGTGSWKGGNTYFGFPSSNRISYYSGGYQLLYQPYTTQDWYFVKIHFIDNNHYDQKIYDSGGNLLGSAMNKAPYGSPTKIDYFRFGGASSHTLSLKIDGLRIRKTTTNEPTINNVGQVETNPTEGYWAKSDWANRRDISITIEEPATIADYNSEGWIDLILTQSNFDYSKSTGDDLRFTDICGNNLRYWVLEWNEQGTSKIKVESDLLSPTENTIYMYYGNNVVDSESEEFYYYDNHDIDRWDHHNRDWDAIFVDEGNSRLNIKTNCAWSNEWSYDTHTNELADDFELEYRYNTRQLSLSGEVYFGVSTWLAGTMDSSYQTDGIYMYYYGGSSGTNNRPTFRLMVEVDDTKTYSPNNLTWQPADNTWYTIILKREGNVVTLEIWDDGKITLYQQHTSNCAGIAQLKHIYVTGMYTGNTNYEYAYVDDLQLREESRKFYSTNVISIMPEESELFTFDIEVSFYENGEPKHNWFKFNQNDANGAPHPNHVLESGKMDVYKGTTIVDTDIYAIMNYEGDGIPNTNYIFAKAMVTLEDWDGTTDIPIQFRFRATSDCATSSVTNFKLYFYDMDNNTISAGGFSASTANPNGLDWLEGKDSGWQIVSYVLDADDFSAYVGQTLFVAFGHSDSWAANWKQRSYLDYLIIGDSTLVGSENAIEVVVYDGEHKQLQLVNFNGGFNPTQTHVYKIERLEDSISFYIDDVLIATFDDNLPYYNPLSLHHVVGLKTIEGNAQIDSIKIEQNVFDILSEPLLGEGFFDDFYYRSPFPLNETSVDDWYEVFGLGKLAQPDDWWNDDWSYRKKLTITNNETSDLFDHQFEITLDTSGANDFNYEHTRSDGADIRFIGYTPNHQKISYWLESWNSTGESSVWVKIPKILASNSYSFYIYYGNNNASSESNGKEVFEFFDGFDDTTLDYDRWAFSSDNGYFTNSGLLYIVNGSVYSKFPIGLQPNFVVDTKLRYYGNWEINSGIGLSNKDNIYYSNNPARKLLMLQTTNNSDSLNVFAADGTVNGEFNIGSTSAFIDPLSLDSWYYFSCYLTSSTTNVVVNPGEHSLEYTAGSWSDTHYLILGNGLGSEACAIDGTDIAVDWILIRKQDLAGIELNLEITEDQKPQPITYYNDHINVDFVENSGEIALLFEYDGDTGELMPEGTRTRTIEHRIQFMTDFSATIPITWWQEQLSAGMEFSVEFCYYHDGIYTLLAEAKLQDMDYQGTGIYSVEAGDDTPTTLTAPISGSAIIEITRINDELTVVFRDSMTHEIIISDQNSYSLDLLNCLRIRFVGLWGEQMDDENNYPSHSQVKIDYIDINAEESNTPTKISYEVTGDIFVDPVSLSYGNGYFCFVKNTPLKPFTVSYAGETKLANEWIVSIIEEYFVNKIEPTFDLFWQKPSESNYQISPYSKFGSELYDNPYQLSAMDEEINGYMNQLSLEQFQGNLAFRPDLTNVNLTECYDLKNGYLENWLVNLYNNFGLGVEYPDMSIYGVQEGRMLYGSTLFYTTFDSRYWNYDFNNDGQINSLDQWQIDDFGTHDYLVNSTGLVYDPFITDDYVLKLEENSIAYDPCLFTEDTLNSPYSTHFLFYGDDFSGGWFPPTENYGYWRMGLDSYIGDPAPTAYFYNNKDSFNMVFFGTKVSTNEIEKLYYDYNTRDWFFEFDYWIGNTSYSNPETMELYFFRPVNDRQENPENVTVLFDDNYFEEIFESLHSDFVDDIYNEENSFKHYDVNLENIFNNFALNHGSEEFMYVVLAVPLSNFENQTMYLDNIRLTADSNFNTGGLGEKYALFLDVTLAADENFDPLKDAKIVNYPIVILDDVYSYDTTTSIDKDYEFTIKLQDPTYLKDIYLHYFWSDDDYIHAENNYHEQVIMESSEIHFYIKRTENIHNSPQIIELNLIETLNRLVQLSRVRLDRSHIIHTLNMKVLVDNYASHLQISSLSIEGISPWVKYDIQDSSHVVSLTDIYGDTIGKSEVTFLATSYLWSDNKQKVFVQLGSNNEAEVLINDQIITKINTSEHSLSTPAEGEVELKPGLNKITVHVLNNEDNAMFKLRFIQSDGSDVLSDVNVLTSKDTFSDSSFITGTFGNGLIGLVGFDFDSSTLNPPFTDEPMLQFITNLLISELEHRNLFYQSVKQRLLSIIQYSLTNKHQDRNLDWHNEDDPFTAFEDEAHQEIIAYIQSIQRDVNLLFHKVMTRARTKVGEVLSIYEQTLLGTLLGQMLHDSLLTGTNYDLNSGYYYYPQSLLFYTLDDPQHPYNYNYPVFQDLDLTRCTAISFDAYDAGHEERHVVIPKGYFESEGESSWNVLELRKLGYVWDWDDETSPWQSLVEYGRISIFSDRQVTVTNTIEDDHGNELLTPCQVSLLEAFNATFISIQDFITFESMTGNTPFLGTLSNLVPTKNIDTMFGELTIGRNLKSFTENWQIELYLKLVSGSLASMAGFAMVKQNRENNDEINHYSRNSETNNLADDYFKPGRDKIEQINENPFLRDYYQTVLQMDGFDFNTMISAEHFTNKISRASYFAGPYENLQIFGDNGLPTDVMLDILAKVKAHYQYAEFLPDDFVFIDNIKGSTTTLVVKPTDAVIKHQIDEENEAIILPSDEGGLEWIKGDVEALSSYSQSFLSLGIHRENNLKLVLSKNDKPAIIRETQLKIDQEVFHLTIQEIMHDQTSPFYRNVKTMLKLEYLGQDSTGEYYQLIGYHPKEHGVEIQSDIIVRKTTAGTYEVAYIREGKNPRFWREKNEDTNILQETKSQECIYSFGDLPSDAELKSKLGLGQDISIDDIVVKKFEFTKDGQEVWIAYRKSIGTTMYALGSEGAVVIPEELQIIKSSWTPEEQRDLKYQESEFTTEKNKFSPHSSISQVDNEKNKFTVITRTETLDSIKAELITLLRKDRNTRHLTEIENIIEYHLMPILALVKAMNKMAGMDDSFSQHNAERNFRKIKPTYLNPREAFVDAIKELSELLNIETFDEKQLEEWTEGLLKHRELDLKKLKVNQIKDFIANIDTIFEICGWSEATLSKATETSSTSNSRLKFLLDITKFIHHESAYGTEKLNQYIDENFKDRKFAPVRSWLYSYLQRKDGGYVHSIDGIDTLIAFINDFDRWYEAVDTNQVAYLGSGRENNRDSNSNGEFSPLLERAKLFMWMEGILASFQEVDQIFDGKNENSPGYLPLTSMSKGGGPYILGFPRRNIYQKTESSIEASAGKGYYVFTQWGNNPAVRLLNGATIASLRANLQVMMHSYLITGGVDIGLGTNLDKLLELVDIDEVVRILIDPNEKMDVFRLRGNQVKVPDPNDLSKQLNELDNDIAVIHQEFSKAFSIFSDSDLKRYQGKSGESVIDTIGRSLYAQRLFRETGDTSDYTFGDLLIDGNYEMAYDGDNLKFYKHVTYWDPTAIPRDMNGNELEITDPTYSGGAWVTEKIELGEHQQEHVLTIDSDFKKDDVNYFIKDSQTQIHTIGAAKIPIIKINIGGNVKYRVFGNFFVRKHATHDVTVKDTNVRKLSTTLEPCIISDEQISEFLDKTGIQAWIDANEDISNDDVEIIPMSNDLEKKMDLQQTLMEEIQKELHENNNQINPDSTKNVYQLKLAVFSLQHALGQLQYLGIGLNFGQKGSMSISFNRFMFYRRRVLKLISKIQNQLRRSEKNDGLIDYKKVQELLRATIHARNKLARKISCLKDPMVPGRSPHQKGFISNDDAKRFNPKTISEYLFGFSAGVFALNNMVGFFRNVKTQLWQSKIIEFSSYALQEDTYMMNEWSRKPGSDGTYVAEDAEVGYLDKRYSIGELDETASFWKYGEALIYAGAVWITDYIEVGPADCFEYFNGMLNGIQLAKCDYGMQAASMDSASSVVVCLQEFVTEVLPINLPDWLSNATQVTKNPVFKTFWFMYLFLLGSTISVFTELIKACTMSTFVGGLVGTGISLGASMFTQRTWSGINEATVQSLTHTGLSDHWTYYQEGDEGVYWKIKSYKVMNWLYGAGSALRPENAFFEVFYLSTYFPNIGEWAGPFDSMIPFIVLTSAGVGLILSYVVSILTPIAVASGALTAGIGTLIVAAVIAFTFIVLRVLKALGVFKKRNSTTSGDD
ncbi:MAG: DUF2341 domain-containing protein [Candidatus Heimdallarchaeota archaeon]|nr:DUF2341 domain-containing protein [Candidatus Heimdallarchaeota archaeon]